MSVNITRDPRLSRDTQKENEKPLNRLRILSVSSLGDQAPVDNGNGPTELAVKVQFASEIALPSGELRMKLSSPHSALISPSPTTIIVHQPSNPGDVLREKVFIGDTDEINRILTSPNPPDVNQTTEPRYLTLAAKRGFADIAGLLLRSGADVNAASCDTQLTALMVAASAGHTMTVITLLQWGANPDAINLKSDTALLRAIRRGHLPCVLVLLAYGANPIPCNVVRPKGYLLPLQLARHLGHQEIQNALINASCHFDQYLLKLVRSSLPSQVLLVDPGHVTAIQSITPRSLSFIPVQLVSKAFLPSPLLLAFNTPPHYSDHFSSIGDGKDELILLYVACVDLEEGHVIPPRSDRSMPNYTHVYFNGSRSSCLSLVLYKHDSISQSPESSIDDDEVPGFRVFVLGNRLNNGGLNSLTLETSPRSDHQGPIKALLPTPGIRKASSPFEKLLIGIYRVRIQSSALSEFAPIVTGASK